jgi:peptidyl-prolyl cis-trans isomerase D
MIQGFRNFFKSKIGIGVTLAFLAVIAVAFASSDVANTGFGGAVTADERVAVVGGRRINAAELSLITSSAFDQARQSNPALTMQAFIAGGGMEQALEQMLSRTALAEFGREHGLRAGDRLIDSELVQIPAFQGPDGKFSREAFNALLSQRGLTEATVRDDFATNLITRQLITPLAMAPMIPRSFGTRYAALLRERRQGSIAILPSTLFAPAGDPTEAQLQAFYQATRNNYIRPERRVIRYATFGEEALGTLPLPTEAQIAQRYQRDRARYAASESRTFTQLIVPTQAAARAILAEVRGGQTLAAAAQEKGLRTASVGPATLAEFRSSTSAAVADAAFKAAQGALVEPARGSLGWYVLRVDQIDRQPARTLAQARDEIAAALAQEQRAAALADLTARVEEEFEEGKSLSDLTGELKLTLVRTGPALADGRIYGQPEQTVPEAIRSVLATAFEMEEGEPQIAPTASGETFMVFDVAAVTPSAVAPLADIRPQVVSLWRRDRGAQAARQAADRVMQRVARGTPLAEAVRTENPNAPAPQRLDLGREQLAQMRRVTPELALMFSMAEGTVKKLEAPADGGWLVIQLDDVAAGQVAPNDPLLAATLQQLARVGSDEQVEQFVKAAEREVGVERNPEAIAAVAAQLTGQTN